MGMDGDAVADDSAATDEGVCADVGAGADGDIVADGGVGDDHGVGTEGDVTGDEAEGADDGTGATTGAVAGEEGIGPGEGDELAAFVRDELGVVLAALGIADSADETVVVGRLVGFGTCEDGGAGGVFGIEDGGAVVEETGDLPGAGGAEGGLDGPGHGADFTAERTGADDDQALFGGRHGEGELEFDEIGANHAVPFAGGGAPGQADAKAAEDEALAGAAESIAPLSDKGEGDGGGTGVAEFFEGARGLSGGQAEAFAEHFVDHAAGLMEDEGIDGFFGPFHGGEHGVDGGGDGGGGEIEDVFALHLGLGLDFDLSVLVGEVEAAGFKTRAATSAATHDVVPAAAVGVELDAHGWGIGVPLEGGGGSGIAEEGAAGIEFGGEVGFAGGVADEEEGFGARALGGHFGGEEEAVGIAGAAEVDVEGGAGGGKLESVLDEAGGGGVVEVWGLGDEDEIFDFGAVPAEVIEEAVGGGGGEVGTELMGQAEAASVDAGHGGEAGADFGGSVLAIRDLFLVAGDGCG